MSWETILTSGTIAALIGAIVKLIGDRQRKKLELRLTQQNKEVEIKLQSLKDRQNYDYDLLINSLKSIWQQLTIIENYILIKISKDFVFDPQLKEIRQAIHNIRSSTLFLPDDIYEDIDTFLRELLEKNFNKMLTDIRNKFSEHGFQEFKANMDENPELIREIQPIVGKFQTTFWKQKDELRVKIRNKYFDYVTSEMTL